jgi:IS5 family transposase
MGQALMENRHGLAVGGKATHATGAAERNAALALIDRHRSAGRVTLGGDKGYDVADFVEALREREVTPHIAINGHVRKSGRARKTAIDRRTIRHPGYAISQVIRRRIEEIFGWSKSAAGLAQVKLRGLAKVNALFTFGLVAYNLIRLPKLVGAPA